MKEERPAAPAPENTRQIVSVIWKPDFAERVFSITPGADGTLIVATDQRIVRVRVQP